VTGCCRPNRRFGRFYALALAFYTLFLVTAQFEHHDLLCHLKTPQHCTSCASSPLGADPQKPETLERCRLYEAGRAIAVERPLLSAFYRRVVSDRAPPSFS
jgi:hypothetical protein